MEPEGSLPHSQVPATCPYPEPARFSLYPHILLLEVPSEYYPPVHAWVSQVASFPQVSSPKPCTRITYPPFALHSAPISFFFILWLLLRKLWFSGTSAKLRKVTISYDVSVFLSVRPHEILLKGVFLIWHFRFFFSKIGRENSRRLLTRRLCRGEWGKFRTF